MRLKGSIPFLALVFLSGCAAGLEEVRDFAKESAKFTEYKELTERYRGTYEREQPYLFGGSEITARETDKKRKEEYKDLIKIHRALSSYMRTLARLAGEKTFGLAEETSLLGSKISEHPGLGIKKEHVIALSNIGKIVSRWMTASIQNRAVREMITESDPDVQKLLAGMKEIVGIYRKTHENEKKTVLGMLEAATVDLGESAEKAGPGATGGTDAPEEPGKPDRACETRKDLLTALGRDRLREKSLEYSAMDKKYSEALRGIEKIVDGHRKLRENVDRLSAGEIRDFTKAMTEEIKAVKKNLDEIQS